MDDKIIVLITASSRDEAERIAYALVDGRLAACVNIVPSVRSVFSWQGKTQEAEETLLVCKSRKSLFAKLSDSVKNLHSYTVPEIIALPIVAGSAEYLSWIQQSTGE
jgi:periplasmic divalent cation tolerance protein